jgi:hypothetical protein
MRATGAQAGPTPERVARRAFVLAGVAYRAQLEAYAGDESAERSRQAVLHWLDEAGHLGEAESAERRLLCQPLGSLDEREAIDASWQAEGLGILAWALGRHDLAACDRSVRARDAADALGFMRPSGIWLPGEARLRARAEIDTLSRRLRALHWRLRLFAVVPEHLDFLQFARDGLYDGVQAGAFFGPEDLAGLPLAEGDLALDDRPLVRSESARWVECLSLTRSRQQATEWLRGGAARYSEVPIEP